MTEKVDSKEVGSFLRTLADIGDQLAAKFPDADTSTMFRVFFDQMLDRATPQERLIAAARIIEKVDDESLRFINAMTVKEAEKRGLNKTSTPSTNPSSS